MSLNIRHVQIVGTLILLLGATGFATASYVEADYDCVSGTVLDIQVVDEKGTTDLQSNTISFGNLSAVEQRIFLEAYTYSAESYGVSDVYANWSESWFDEMGTYDEPNSPLYVAHQGSYYEVIEGHVDCGLSNSTFVQLGGILSVLLGGGILGVVGVLRMREANK